MRGVHKCTRIELLAKARQAALAYDPDHGKGSHGRVSLGSSFTALKNPKQEIGMGLLHKMCHDLGIKATDL